MANITDTEEVRLLDLSLPDDNVWLALTSTAPSDSAAGTEITGGNYARQPISMAAASGGSKSNDTQILFPEATGAAWAEIQGYDIYTAVTAGTRRWHFTLAVDDRRTVSVGDQYRIAVGALSFALQ